MEFVPDERAYPSYPVVKMDRPSAVTLAVHRRTFFSADVALPPDDDGEPFVPAALKQSGPSSTSIIPGPRDFSPACEAL